MGLKMSDLFVDERRQTPEPAAARTAPAADCHLVEIVLGGFNSPGRIEDRVRTILAVDGYGKTGLVDCAVSLYRHTEEIHNHMSEKGRVVSYNGCFAIDFIPFDIDCADNLEDARLSTIRLIETLCDKHKFLIDDILLFFSGASGFHVFAKSRELGEMGGRTDMQKIVRAMAEKIIGDIPHVDKAIYSGCTRLIRIPNSINSKSGLYKIPLLASEIYCMSILDIKKRAQRQRNINEAVDEWLEHIPS